MNYMWVFWGFVNKDHCLIPSLSLAVKLIRTNDYIWPFWHLKYFSAKIINFVLKSKFCLYRQGIWIFHQKAWKGDPLLNIVKYQGVNEFYLLVHLSCYCKMMVFFLSCIKIHDSLVQPVDQDQSLICCWVVLFHSHVSHVFLSIINCYL